MQCSNVRIHADANVKTQVIFIKEDDMFSIGDAVFHPGLGAGIVVGLPNFIMQKKNQQYYKINIIGRNKTVIMVPVKKAEEQGLRHAISSLELESVWQVLSDYAQDLPHENKKRTKALQDKVKVPMSVTLAEVIRDLEWWNLHKGHLNSTEKGIYDHAMEMLAGEIAVSLDVQLQSARTKIKKVLSVSLANNLV
jgi:RNA polymerase-interacting CarD/CdnL/TRCF family regulator